MVKIISFGSKSVTMNVDLGPRLLDTYLSPGMQEQLIVVQCSLIFLVRHNPLFKSLFSICVGFQII